MPLLLDAPNLGEREKKKLLECLESTYVSTAGPSVPEFEERFARFLDAPAAVAVQSGTAALHMALAELNIGPGDEVILPALSFVATANPVLYAGATPVLVDVDPETWNLDVRKVEEALTPRTKAVMPVHLYGNPCDMDALCGFCKDRRIPLLEDATESLGATWQGKATGTLGEFGCFSFNGNKLITTGGGGMFVARDPERARHVKFLVNQARDASKGYFHPELGYNYRMTNLEASLGLAQLERIHEFLGAKRRFAAIYQEVLKGLEGVTLQKELPQGESAWWLPSMVTDRLPIPELQEALRQQGIPTRRVFCPLHSFPYLKQYAPRPCPEAERIYECGLSLPASTANDDESLRHAAEILRDILKKGR